MQESPDQKNANCLESSFLLLISQYLPTFYVYCSFILNILGAPRKKRGHSNFKVDRIMNTVFWLIFFILLILKIHFNLSTSAEVPRKNVKKQWHHFLRLYGAPPVYSIFKTYSILILGGFLFWFAIIHRTCMRKSHFFLKF